jgi:hypothetical protein
VKDVLDFLIPVFGLDAGNNSRIQLEKTKFLKKMYATILSSKLPVSHNIIIGILLSYGERSDDMGEMFAFMKSKSIDIDSIKNAMMSTEEVLSS